MPILEISVIPIGTESPSIGELVAESCKNVKSKNLEYKVTPTSTLIKGNLDDLLDVAKEMHSAPLKAGVNRVITSMKIDERTDKDNDWNEMILEVTQQL